MVFFKQLTVTQLVDKFAEITEPEGLSACSQKHAFINVLKNNKKST
jgi:hypothetical protein